MGADVQRDPDRLERAAARLRHAAADLRTDAGAATAGSGTAARLIADELDSLAATAAHTATTTRDTDTATAVRLRDGIERHRDAPGGAGPCTPIP
ncbi:hypothetical protein [Pseudonocardia sp. HH130630-07]|uniref:hypothetical protein n=1 Tax=Pseudonocardia sp. HH130630-07 TaxID=1690815 RepID=UPI000815269C|nr:hypothetical protein [Pseudonocardia sp. HH130630-07]ANY07446.1 hypothetical protein AFB00_15370 [Pseudonocardia sp. HH130630-07]